MPAQGIRTCARHDYMPFGEEVAPQVPPPADKRLFTGKERDPETGLDYFEARYLRASVGRFSTVDPIRVLPERLLDPQQLNLYSYVRNNPLRWIDPDGNEIRTTAPDTIRSIAGDAVDRIIITNGVVDTSRLTSDDLSTNEGALLLSQLAISPHVYTYWVD